MNKVTTVVVTYNGEKWIRKCLNSLKESSIKTHVIVIDNDSTDSTVQIIEQEFLWVELIKSKENLGFGKGNNIGLKRSLDDNADYVFLLNQDAWIAPDTLQILVDFSKNNPVYGILSPVALNGAGKRLDGGTEMSIVSFSDRNMVLKELLSNKKPIVIDVKFINAAGWLLTRECINKVGGFDPLFFYRGEDLDYCNRVKYHKLKIALIPGSIYYHDRLPKLKSNSRTFEERFNLMMLDELVNFKNIQKKLDLNKFNYFRLVFVKVLRCLYKFRIKTLLLNVKVGLKTYPLIDRIKLHRDFSMKKRAFIE